MCGATRGKSTFRIGPVGARGSHTAAMKLALQEDVVAKKNEDGRGVEKRRLLRGYECMAGVARSEFSGFLNYGLDARV
jgi:hypothetical protein